MSQLGRNSNRDSFKPDGNRVRALRKAKGWTQEDLASKAGYDKKTIENIEAGKFVRPSTLDCVAKALGVQLNYIFINETSSALVLRNFLDLLDTSFNKLDLINYLSKNHDLITGLLHNDKDAAIHSVREAGPIYARPLCGGVDSHKTNQGMADHSVRVGYRSTFLGRLHTYADCDASH